jgi:phosphomethylpyrimidine synthase
MSATTTQPTQGGNPKPANTAAPAPGQVTTGPIRGSRKVYSSPDGHPDIRVPFREIALDPAANEPPLRVYDTSGPYTDHTAKIDVRTGLPKLRSAWLAKRSFDRHNPAQHPPGRQRRGRGQLSGPALPGPAHSAEGC